MSNINVSCNDIYNIINLNLSNIQDLVKNKGKNLVDEISSDNGFNNLLKQFPEYSDILTKNKSNVKEYIKYLPGILSDLIKFVLIEISKQSYLCLNNNIQNLCSSTEIYILLTKSIKKNLNIFRIVALDAILFLLKDKIIDIIKSGLNYDLLNGITPASLCKNILNTCELSFCSNGLTTVDPKISVSCLEINKVLNVMFSNPKFLKEFNNLLNKTGVFNNSSIQSIKQICQQLKSIGNTEQLSSIVNSNIQKAINNSNIKNWKNISYLYKKYSSQLPTLIKCICPDIDTKISKPALKIKKFNTKLISFLGISLIIIGIIIFSIANIFVKSKYLLFVGVIILMIFIFGIIIKANPSCLLMSCVKNSKYFNEIPKGKYKGKKSFLGLITLFCDLDVTDINNIKLELLSCQGKVCPFSNITEECKNQNITLDIKNREELGIHIQGQCIDVVKAIKTSDNTSVIKNLWLAKVDDDFVINIALHLTGKFNIDMIVNIELTKN